MFDEYEITFGGVANALGLDLVDGAPPALRGAFADYQVLLVAGVDQRQGRAVPLTRLTLALPSPAKAEVQVATRSAEALFGVPEALPVVDTGNKQFEARLAMRSADRELALAAVLKDFQNKLSVMDAEVHLWARGGEAGFEIVGENTDANYWVNAIEMLGKVADRVRRG
jgi:hypothetical protein